MRRGAEARGRQLRRPPPPSPGLQLRIIYLSAAGSCDWEGSASITNKPEHKDGRSVTGCEGAEVGRGAGPARASTAASPRLTPPPRPGPARGARPPGQQRPRGAQSPKPSEQRHHGSGDGALRRAALLPSPRPCPPGPAAVPGAVPGERCSPKCGFFHRGQV